MPRGDRSGPEGRGSMTGRGLGYCAGYNEPGFTAGRDRCFGRGRGYGRYGNSDIAYDRSSEPVVSEKTLLENKIRILKDQLNTLEKRLEESKKG